MGRTITMLLFLVFVTGSISSCRTDRVEVHNMNGKVRRMKSRKIVPWHTPNGSGYSKRNSRKLRRWDNSFHK